MAPLYSELYILYSTPKHLADLVKLLRGETNHANMLAHMDRQTAGAVERALTSIATGADPPDPASKTIWRLLISERHPLSDPDNLARAVMLWSDDFAEQVLMNGYRSAITHIGGYLRRLAETGLTPGLLELYKTRLRSAIISPGLILPDRCRPDPAVLQAMGYNVRPGPVYIPLRNLSDEGVAAIVRHLHRPTGLEGLQDPEDVAANLLAAAIMQAVLENRYILALYATADALAGGGSMTVAGPARMPLLAEGGDTAKILDIVEQLFRTAGHRRLKARFLQKYLFKINRLIGACETLANRRLDLYDLRGFWEQEEIVQRVRADALAVDRGGEPDNVHELVRKESKPFKILEPLHLYLNTVPYLTVDQFNLLERVTVRIVSLALIYVSKTAHVDRPDYMSAKLRLSRELAHTLSVNLVPANAHIPRKIRGIDRLVWALIVNPTR